MIDIFWRCVVIGIGATVLMDIWALILAAFFGQARANWAPVGRWFWHLKSGKVFHDSIADAPPYSGELALGWIGHYGVGVVYAFLLVLFTGTQWLANPTFLPALIFGIITVGAGWFLLQPGLGLGWAASKTPNPNKVRSLNILAHIVFAVGLYCTALLVR